MLYFQRNLTYLLQKIVSERPLVYLNGPRQCGKSTLTEYFHTDKKINYVTLDSPIKLAAAKENPEGFLKSLPIDKINVIDEIQKIPELSNYLKISIDENRLKGINNNLYLITGSANLLALPKLSKPLAGRMSVLTLLPFSSSEYKQTNVNFIEKLFDDVLEQKKYSEYDLIDTISNSTYPEIAVDKNITREKWFDDYLNIILQRDVKDVAQIRNPEKIMGLLSVLAMRSGSLINDNAISSEIGLDAKTYNKYKSAVINTFIVFELSAWAKPNNLNKRFTKSKKLYFNDINLLMYILRRDLKEIYNNNEPVMGHLFENFAATEILKNVSSIIGARVSHFRTVDKKEVDFVVEKTNGDTLGIEVKLEKSVHASDFNNLKILASVTGGKFKKGVVLYTGRELISFANNLWAVPLNYLWEK